MKKLDSLQLVSAVAESYLASLRLRGVKAASLASHMYVGRDVESGEIRGIPRAAFSLVCQSGKKCSTCRDFDWPKLEETDAKTDRTPQNQFVFRSCTTRHAASGPLPLVRKRSWRQANGRL
jgi:hypothetical protein